MSAPLRASRCHEVRDRLYERLDAPVLAATIVLERAKVRDAVACRHALTCFAPIKLGELATFADDEDSVVGFWGYSRNRSGR